MTRAWAKANPRTLRAFLVALNNYPLAIDPVQLQRVTDVMRQFGLLSEHFSIATMLP